jgi:hypothetical protein
MTRLVKKLHMHGENGVGSIDQGYVSTDQGKTFSQMVSVENDVSPTDGSVIDAPVSTTVAQTIASATKVGLLKGLVNLCILIYAFLIGASKGAGVTDSTTLRVVTANDGPLNTTITAIFNLLTAGIKTSDNGPSQTITRTITAGNSTMKTTPVAITPAPTSGKALVAVDVWVSNLSATALNFYVKMETSNNRISPIVPVAANSKEQITLRGYLKADAIDKKFIGVSDQDVLIDVMVNHFSEPL